MGPVRKVLKANAGSSLLKDPKFIGEIVREVKSNVSKPVGIKIRAGRSHLLMLLKLQKKLKGWSCLISVHGRTKSLVSRNNLDYIKQVKENVNICNRKRRY